MPVGRTFAEAVIRILPDTSLVGTRIREQLAKDMPAAGIDAGDKFNAGFGNALDDKLQVQARRTSENFSKAWGSRLKDNMDGEATKVAASFGNVTEGEFRKIGDNDSNAYTDNFHRSLASRLGAGIRDMWHHEVSSQMSKNGDDDGHTYADRFGRTASDIFVSAFVHPFRGMFAAEFLTAILAAVAIAGPAAAAILIASFVAVIGLGAIGAALALQFSNPQVKEGLSSLGKTISQEFKNVTQPFVKPLTDAFHILSVSALENIPKLAPGFRSLSEVVVTLANGFAKMFAVLTPALNILLGTSALLVYQLGKELPGFGAALAKFFLILSEAPGQLYGLHLLFVLLNGTLIGVAYTLYGLAVAFAWIHGKIDEFVHDFGPRISVVAGEVWGWFHDKILPAIEAFGKAAFDTLKKIPGWINQYIVPAAKDIIAIFGPQVREGLKAIQDHFDGIKNAGLNLVHAVGPAIKDIFDFLAKNKQTVQTLAVVFAAWIVTIEVWTAVARVAAVVQAIWNAEMVANPIAIVVLLLVGLVAAIIYAWTHFATFRIVVEGVWNVLKTGALYVVEFFIGPFIAGFRAVLGFFAGPFVGFFVGLGAWFAGPFVNFFKQAWADVAGAALWLWARMQEIWNAIWGVVQYFWNAIHNNIILAMIAAFVVFIPAGLAILVGWVVFHWNAVWGAIKGAWGAIWANVIAPIIRFFTQDIPIAAGVLSAWISFHWNAVWTAIKSAWDAIWAAVIAPIIRFFTNDIPVAAATMKIWVQAHWEDMRARIDGVWQWLYNNVFGPIKNVITQDIPNAFREGVAAIGRFWEDLKAIVAKPINFVIKTVLEDGILGAIRWIASKVGVNFDVHVTPIPGYAAGGLIRGPGGPRSDQILGVGRHGIPTARVSAGEFVTNAQSTKDNLHWLHAINSGVNLDNVLGKLPGFDIGGLVGNIGGFVKDAAGGLGRAISGLGQHAIDLITDPAKIITDDLGKLLGGIPGAGIAKDLPIGAAKKTAGWLADWVKAKITSIFSTVSGDVLAIQQWLKSHVDGLPYTWGAVGPDTFDCSGLVGEVIARLLHLPSYTRYFVTGDASEGAFLQGHGFTRGKGGAGDLIVGYTPEHTMGVLAGLPFEAGSTPLHVGSGTSDINSFPSIWTLKLGSLPGGGFSAAAAGAAQLYAQSLLPGHGWGQDQFGPLQALWNKESNWNPNAINPSSGAYGIPQALGQGHPFNIGDANAQIIWGLDYIAGRYGSPAAAWAHEQAFNWYDKGGWFPNNTIGINTSGKKEYVSTGDSIEDLLERLIEAVESVGGDVGEVLKGGMNRARVTSRTRGA